MPLIDGSLPLIGRSMPLIDGSLSLIDGRNGITETTYADEKNFILNRLK